jgi:hypothetical protein
MKECFETSTGYKMVEEDDYKDGCQIGTAFDIMYDVKFEAPSLDELITLLKEHFEVSHGAILLDSCDEAGRIDIQRMENGDGDLPSENELERWKRGEIKMWAATYTYTVEVVDRKVVRLETMQKFEGADR